MRTFQISVAFAAILASGALATADVPKQPPAKVAPAAANSPTDPAEVTYKDVEATLGFVPQFMRSIPRSYVATFWQSMKTFEMNPATKLDLKTKELIGVAVAAQIPCEYCVQFHTDGARMHGATNEEIQEAVAMAGMTRLGSTLLNGLQIDKVQFKKDMARIEQHARQQAKK
ncbi:MAG: alkyl hydroperoxide reductase AhpD [Deltaproteobacteria bacterium]|nr:alkyl hydroperoxide reductase AhpD [Deltaproteobacteria bacterium]